MDITSDNVPDNKVTYWNNEILAAKKREKKFRKKGNDIIEIYEADDPEKNAFNILFSNTETMAPAMYSQTPRPIVKRRFNDEDPLGKEASKAGQRMLEFLLDTNIEGYETFDDSMKATVLDGLLPGRGHTTVKYTADIEDRELIEGEEEPQQYKSFELVCTNSRSWNRVFYGYAKKWTDVHWVAYEEYIDKEESLRLLGEKSTEKLVFTTGRDETDDRDETEDDEDEKNLGERKTALIYQIWDKDTRKIRYISPQYGDDFLAVKDDPLELTGFFDCPKPIQFIDKVNDMVPVAMYTIYQNQAKELNRLTVRINHVADAIKAKGVYDGELGDDIKNLLEGEDNEFIPADKASSLASEKGFQNAIWFMPLNELITTLTQLYTARNQSKQVIYEITGIADIMRGSSNASETLGAQEIKNQWGTLRIKPKQKEVQRFARDLLRIMLEIAASKFDEETWGKMTGLPYLTTEQRAQVEQMAGALKQSIEQDKVRMQQEAEQLSLQPQDPNQPPQPPQPNPQLVQQMEQIQAELAKPQWSQILGLLRDDLQRSFQIDIETNSTIEPEAAEDQKNLADLMNAMSQFLNGVAPLIDKGIMPFEAAQAMLLTVTKRFRFGDEVEDLIKQMKQPPPDQSGQEEAQAKQAEMQAATQEKQADMAFEKEKFMAEQQAEQAKIQMEGQAKIAEIQAKLEAEMAKIAKERESDIAKLNSQRATSRMEAELKQDTALKEAAMTMATQIEISKNTPQVEGEPTDTASMDSVMETMNQLLAVIAEPKKVVVTRDGNGMIAGAEVG